jgi:peptide-methionine (S)-S-oxide reductase
VKPDALRSAHFTGTFHVSRRLWEERMRRFLSGLLGSLGIVLALAIGAALPSAAAERATAIFAGGCFWCVEADFDKVPGVISTVSGYTGGTVDNPTYQQVSAGGTGHAEAVEVVYDPARVSYTQLLDYFWRHVDPTVKDRQFCDGGNQYRTAIFVGNDEERKLAEASKQKVAKELNTTIYTEIAKAGAFYKAEDYHQDYYEKNPAKYKFYRWSCGRDQRLEQVWGKHKGDS